MRLIYTETGENGYVCPECKWSMYKGAAIHKAGCSQTGLDNCDYYFNTHAVRLAKWQAEELGDDTTGNPISIKLLKEHGYAELIETIPAITNEELQCNLQKLANNLYEEKYTLKLSNQEISLLRMVLSKYHMRTDNKELPLRILKKIEDIIS